MKYRVLGRTGLRVSVVGVGTWQFGGEWGKTFDQDEVNAMFAAARDCGINLIDTAECYGDHLSEALIGAAIEGQRDQWVLCSKFGHHFHGPFNRTEPRSPQDLVTQTEASLRALRTDHLDLQQYHSWGDDRFFDDDVLATLQKLQQQGKVRHIGNSVSSNTNVKQVAASDQRGLQTIQIIYNRLDRAPETTTLPICQQQNLGVLARVPLASGYLSGKYQVGARFDQGDVRSRQEAAQRDQRIAQAQQIIAAEATPGVPVAQWALAWCLQHPAVTCVIPGCKDVAQVRGNAAAADLDLVRDDHPQAR
jgi:aryl-alcohol dehydrogenase-like predicted oxidoreductase